MIVIHLTDSEMIPSTDLADAAHIPKKRRRNADATLGARKRCPELRCPFRGNFLLSF